MGLVWVASMNAFRLRFFDFGHVTLLRAELEIERPRTLLEFRIGLALDSESNDTWETSFSHEPCV